MASGNNAKNNFYKWIKIGGLLSFIPFVLAAGPFTGYVLGEYLEKKIGTPPYVSILLVTLGFIGSVRETVRIVKIALKAEEGK